MRNGISLSSDLHKRILRISIIKLYFSSYFYNDKKFEDIFLAQLLRALAISNSKSNIIKLNMAALSAMSVYLSLRIQHAAGVINLTQTH